MLAPRLTGTDHSVNPGPVRVETQISDLPIPPARAEAKKSVVSSLAKLGCQSLAVELRGAPARIAGSQQQNMVGGGVGVGVGVGVKVGVNVGVIVGVIVGVPVGVTVGTAIEHKLHCASAPEGRQAWKLPPPTDPVSLHSKISSSGSTHALNVINGSEQVETTMGTVTGREAPGATPVTTKLEDPPTLLVT